jgi:hypothetical protein
LEDLWTRLQRNPQLGWECIAQLSDINFSSKLQSIPSQISNVQSTCQHVQCEKESAMKQKQKFILILKRGIGQVLLEKGKGSADIAALLNLPQHRNFASTILVITDLG